MLKPLRFLILILVLSAIWISCKKGPGLGGQATITGRVHGMLWDKTFTIKLDSGYVGNWTVNIIYGNDVAIDANQKTSYDGSYQFQYLRPGHYKIFVYSRARKTNAIDSALVREMDITSTKQQLTIPDIEILH